MRDVKRLTYDICRSYLLDQEGALAGWEVAKIHGWIRSRDLAKLASVRELLDCECSSVERERVLMQIEAFFKKNAAFTVASDATAAALESFKDSEANCRDINTKLDELYGSGVKMNTPLDLLLNRAQLWITSVLGPFANFLGELPENIKFTGGATATSKREVSQAYTKVSKRPQAPLSAQPYLSALSEWFGYGKLKVRPLCANRLEVVPKNWKTGRLIACEPSGSVPLQLAFDGHAKRCLKKRGIDLSDQSKNQRMAKEGSVSGKYATIDLSAASDNIAYNVVALLFPFEWFRYLADVRSPLYFVRGTAPQKYEKFSSMGNGSTFAIETLIFSALCHAAGSTGFSVYGDDIIIETEFVDILVEALEFLGFSVNQKKSYTSGPFRESCGGNYFDGVDITPFYLRGWAKSKSAWCHNVNGLVGVSKVSGLVWDLLAGVVREEQLPLVPFNGISTSGVWITPGAALSRGLIKTKHRRSLWIPRYKALGSKDDTMHIEDTRTEFMWFITKDKPQWLVGAGVMRVRFLFLKESDPRSGFEGSRITTSTRVVRKWFRWIPPAVTLPSHLYWWEELTLL